MQNNPRDDVRQVDREDNENFGAVSDIFQNAHPTQAKTDDEKINSLLELLQLSLQNRSSGQRAKSCVDSATPKFRGDHTDKIDCGRWIETFEREARYYELARGDWPMAAAKRFPADSSAANWVDSMFGTGLHFEAEWSSFRRDFLEHFTPPDALPVARANFDNLHLTPNCNVTEFNKKFTDLSTRLNCVLRDSGMPCLTFAAVCLAYQTKLQGPVRIHIDQYLSQRQIFNVERQRDGRAIFQATPKELLAAAQQFASQTVYQGVASGSQWVQQDTSGNVHGTTPMDIDAMIEARLNALQLNGRFSGKGSGFESGASASRGKGSNVEGGGRGGSAVQCWECGGKGHVRSRCATFLARKEKENAGSHSGKGGAQ